MKTKIYSWVNGIWMDESRFFDACKLVAKFNNIEPKDFLNLMNNIANSINVAEIDDRNVWDLCKYGLRTKAIIAYAANFRKNFDSVAPRLVMAKQEVDKIYNIVHKSV